MAGLENMHPIDMPIGWGLTNSGAFKTWNVTPPLKRLGGGGSLERQRKEHHNPLPKEH